MALPLAYANTPAPTSLTALLPDENPDVRAEIADIFDDADLWLRTPNGHFGGFSPEEALQRGQEAAVRNLLREIRYIGMS